MTSRFLLITALFVWSGAIGCSGAVEEEPELRGSVSVFTHVQAGGSTTRLHAAFTRVDRKNCTAQMIGACAIHRCPTTAVAPANAGSVEARVGASSSLLSFPDGADQHDVLATGEAIVFRHSGGDVPAFETTLRQPPPLLLESPLPDGVVSDDAVFSAPRGLTLAIEGTDDVELRLSGAAPDSRLSVAFDAANVSCDFDASSGSVVLPVSTLRAAGASSGRLIAATSIQLSSGDWRVTVAAGREVFVRTRTPTGSGSFGWVNLLLR